MSQQTPAQVFFPILGRLLGVSAKVVLDHKDPIPANSPKSWIEKEERHANLTAFQKHRDLREIDSVLVNFPLPLNPKRLTIHFRRNSEHGGQLPLMAAGRASEDKSFGFSLQPDVKNPEGQNFLNLVYQSETKPAGFEPLYIKTAVSKEFIYLKISITTITIDKSAAPVLNVDTETTLVVEAIKIPESEAPKHLQEAVLIRSVRKVFVNPADSNLKAKLFGK